MSCSPCDRAVGIKLQRLRRHQLRAVRSVRHLRVRTGNAPVATSTVSLVHLDYLAELLDGSRLEFPLRLVRRRNVRAAV